MIIFPCKPGITSPAGAISTSTGSPRFKAVGGFFIGFFDLLFDIHRVSFQFIIIDDTWDDL